MSLIESTLILIAASGAPDEEMSVVEQFGFDSYKLIAQALTFVAVWFILKWKAYGPILEMLEKRKQRIAEGEENLKKIAEDLKDAEAKKSEIISEANAKAEKMISEARESAEAVAAKKREEAGKEAATIIGEFVFGNFPGIPNCGFQLAQNGVADLGVRPLTIGRLSQRCQARPQRIGSRPGCATRPRQKP